jgi:cell division protein FtsL
MRMSFRLIVSLVLAITLVSLLFTAYQVETENRSKRNELERRAQILAQSLRETIEPLLD